MDEKPEGAERFRSSCSVARSLDLLGDRWTLLILRDVLWHGKSRFGELQGGDERMPTNILSDRLRKLVGWGLLEKKQYEARPPRFAYVATERARALEPALLALMRWGHEELGGGLYDPATGETLVDARR